MKTVIPYPNEVQTAHEAFGALDSEFLKSRDLHWYLFLKKYPQQGGTMSVLQLASRLCSEIENNWKARCHVIYGLNVNQKVAADSLLQDKIEPYLCPTSVVPNHLRSQISTDRFLFLRFEATHVEHYIKNGLATPRSSERFSSFEDEPDYEHDRFIIILDEEHLGQGRDSQSSKLLAYLEERIPQGNLGIIGVSATGSTTLQVASEFGSFEGRPIRIRLVKPGEGYYGPEEIIADHEKGERVVDSPKSLSRRINVFAEQVILEYQGFQDMERNWHVEASFRCPANSSELLKIKEKLQSHYRLLVHFRKVVCIPYGRKFKRMKLERRMGRGPKDRDTLYIHLFMKACSISETISSERLESFLCMCELPYDSTDRKKGKKTQQARQHLRICGYRGERRPRLMASIQLLKAYQREHELGEILAHTWSDSKAKKTFAFELISRAQAKDLSKRVCSKNKDQNLARQVLENHYRSGRDMRVFYMDGPHPAYRADWERLMEAHPEYRGKYLQPVLQDEEVTQVLKRGVRWEPPEADASEASEAIAPPPLRLVSN